MMRIVVLLLIFVLYEGSVKSGDKIKMMATGKEFEVIEVGVFTPKPTLLDELTVGDVGYLTACD